MEVKSNLRRVDVCGGEVRRNWPIDLEQAAHVNPPLVLLCLDSKNGGGKLHLTI